MRARKVNLNAQISTCYKLYHQEKSFSVIAHYLSALEVLKLQQLSKYFYQSLMLKVHDNFSFPNKRLLMTRTGTSSIKDDIIELCQNKTENKLTFHRPDFGNQSYISI